MVAINARFVSASLILFLSSLVNAAQLAEDRADVLYHRYDGGGVTIDGPSVLVRKDVGEKVSLSGNYYVDYVTSASIDVVTQGSPYTEERTEYSVGADYLHDKSTLSLHYTNSQESDYKAETFSFGISQDFFGDLSTLTLNFAQGDNWVGRNRKESLEGGDFQKVTDHVGDAETRRFSLGFTQILSKNWIVAFNVESVIDEGFLNNPYRQTRSYNEDFDGSLSAAENYPNTRNSDAAAIRSMFYLPYRAALKLEARTFSDSWDIQATNYEVRYTHPLNEKIILELKARTYEQTQAFFYQDIFNNPDSGSSGIEEFRARDKELSEFDSQNFGIGITYEFKNLVPFTKKQSLSFFWDYMQFNYLNFRNACKSMANDFCKIEYDVGEEPFYSLEANVVRLFFSVNY